MSTIEQARQWYADADPVHDFDHVLRVYRLAERIGRAEGADLEILCAAALLHDAAGATPDPHSDRPTHHLASAEFAREVLSGGQQVRGHARHVPAIANNGCMWSA